MTQSKREKAILSVIYENQTLNALYISMASDYCFMKILSKGIPCLVSAIRFQGMT